MKKSTMHTPRFNLRFTPKTGLAVAVAAVLAGALTITPGRAKDDKVKPPRIAPSVAKAAPAVPEASDTPAAPAAPASEQAAKKAPRESFLKLPAFNKKSGAPARTVSAATRAGQAPIRLAVITPITVGQTYREQPSFFWYQSDSSRDNLLFSLYTPDMKEIVLVKHPIPGNLPAGIHRLDLADHGKSLESGKTYLWSITYVVNPRDNSANAVSKGYIEYVQPPKDLAGKLENSDAFEQASTLAQNGIWYDLFTVVADLRKQNPGATDLRKTQQKLIHEVGLDAPVK